MSDVARDAAIASAGAAFVLLGKLLDRAFGWRRNREDFATTLRNELHAETDLLKREIRELRAEVDQWREKYHAAREENGKLRLDYAALRQDFDELMQKLVQSGVTP